MMNTDFVMDAHMYGADLQGTLLIGAQDETRLLEDIDSEWLFIATKARL